MDIYRKKQKKMIRKNGKTDHFRDREQSFSC